VPGEQKTSEPSNNGPELTMPNHICWDDGLDSTTDLFTYSFCDMSRARRPQVKPPQPSPGSSPTSPMDHLPCPSGPPLSIKVLHRHQPRLIVVELNLIHLLKDDTQRITI